MMNFPQILIPKTRDLILPNSHVGMQGWFRLMVRRAEDDSIKQDTGWFPNLITDIGLNRLGTNFVIDRCCIGTGTSTPNVADTSLQAFVASASGTAPDVSGITNEGAPNYVSSREFGYRFVAGQLNGNYSEVGMGWGNTTLWSRALIVDGVGSPTTITVLSNEYLDVFYSVRQVPDLADYTSTVVISGVSYSVTRRPSQVSSTGSGGWRFTNGVYTWSTNSGVTPAIAYTGSLGAVNYVPGGSAAGCETAAQNTYVNNSLEQTGSITFGLTYGNHAGGIKAITVNGSACSYQHEFTPNIPKDSTKQLILNGKVSWNRV